MARLVAYLGGQRSGKSSLAEARLGREKKVAYLATLRPGKDPEMRSRVAEHQKRRPASWTTILADKGLLAAARQAKAEGSRALLLDGLGLWAASGLGTRRDLRSELAAFAKYAKGAFRLCVLTLDECGLGGVSPNRLARRFADLNGLLNQDFCALADEVHWVMAGLSLKVKG